MISNAPGAGSLVPFKELQDSIRSITNEEVISDNLIVSDALDDVSFVYAKVSRSTLRTLENTVLQS